jgi:hypothetical protein
MRFQLAILVLLVGGACSSAEFAKKGKKDEAEVNLDRIGKGAKSAFMVDGSSFPIGSIGPTPDVPCCSAGPDHKCQPDLRQWADSIWDKLDFSVDGPHYFQYSYESADGKTFTAKAIGNLDCDNVDIVYVLAGSIVDTAPMVQLTKPSNSD